MGHGEASLWTWVELPRYPRFCREVCAKIGVPFEGEFDLIRWVIEENIQANPWGATHPDPRFNDEAWRYFRTKEAPAFNHLPPLVITFRIAKYPEFGSPGILEGREVWIEQDLRETGFSLQGEE